MSLLEPIHDPSTAPLVGPVARRPYLRRQQAPALSQARGRLGKLASAAVVIYGTLAVVFFVNPRPVADRLDEFEPNPVVDAARLGVDKVIAVSDMLGLAKLSDAVRSRMKQMMQRPVGSG